MDLKQMFLTGIIFSLASILFYIMITSRERESKRKEQRMSEDDFIVTVPGFIKWPGIICGVLSCVGFGFFIIIMTLFPNGTATWWVYTMFSLFVLLGVFLTVFLARWKIKIKGENIYVSSILTNKVFAFSDITSLKFSQKEVKAYSGKIRIFSASCYYIGYEMLIKKLKSKGLQARR
ncbi:MAG: hypothetical protein FWG14_13065 [Peptococcaceae bacterium]|nr:hypothetical protein [Peptococcaceae bacterium]